jgi:cellulose biosynthesis protein BcsQ
MDLLCAPGVTAMIQRLDFLRVERAWKGDLLGVLPNFYNASNGQSAWGYNTLREFHEPLLLDPIRSSTEYDEARQRGKTAYDLDRPTMAVEDFDRLAARVV